MEHLEHTFHTRHDFTPELGWAAFQLLAEIGADGTTVEGLEEAARTLASPMARRSDLRKLLRSMDELGLLARSADKLCLSAAGRALAASAGRYEPGFFAGIHCLYAWGWQWGGRAEVSHAILELPPGVQGDPDRWAAGDRGRTPSSSKSPPPGNDSGRSASPSAGRA